MENLTILRNEEKQGIELYFNSKPAQAVLETLKSNGFRWHSIKKCWYAKDSEKIQNAIISLNNGEIAPSKTAQPITKKEIKNKFGVKVGDVFVMSWGYEQTNLDFFVVVELVGSQSVRIKECVLEIAEEETYAHGMARDVAFNPSKVAILERSYFCKKDQNGKGLLKRVCQMGDDSIYLKMTSYANAYPYKGKKMYNSWYA